MALLLGAALSQQDGMTDLADGYRWDEIIWRAGEQLAEDPTDHKARYWLGRASVEQARVLLKGRAFSRDLARSMLRRAREQLALVPAGGVGLTSDAPEWEAFARYLGGGDADLATDLEVWFALEGRGYAAYLRGLIGVDEKQAAAVTWFERAATASPDRPLFALDWAGALARAGHRRDSLAAWRQARDNNADFTALLGRLLSILPAEGDAATRLAELDGLLSRKGAEDDGLLAWYRAFSLEQLGRLTEAESVMARAKDHRTWDVDLAHARLLELQGRRTDAAALLGRTAGEGDQRALDQLINLGDSAARERRWDEGLGYYEVALGIEPMSERAVLNRALLLAQSGRSMTAYQLVVERYSARSDILNDAALAAWGWQQLDQSAAWFSRAAEMPGAADARENLAALLLDSDSTADHRARLLLDTVLTDEPERDRALYLRHLARPSSSH